MAQKKKVEKITQNVALAGLLLNILLLPGLGSIVGKRTHDGIIQLVLALSGGITIVIGFIISLTVVGAIIGLPMMIVGSIMPIGAWIWGLITGIQMLEDAQ